MHTRFQSAFAVQYTQPDGQTITQTGFPSLVSAERFEASIRAAGASAVKVSRYRLYVAKGE